MRSEKETPPAAMPLEAGRICVYLAPVMTWIFRLCLPPEWAAFRESGRFAGGPDDVRDGFLHFSAADQIAETARRHYPASGDLILLAVDSGPLGAALAWEESRGGVRFPHLHAELPLAAVAAWRRIGVPRDFAFLADFTQPTEASGWISTR